MIIDSETMEVMEEDELLSDEESEESEDNSEMSDNEVSVLLASANFS